MSAETEEIAEVRAFNRFYTRLIGVLDEGLHKSPYSLTESRVLYELAHADGLTAASLRRDLDLDAGYLSRILKKFEADGLLSRAASPDDGRESVLALTDAGREAFRPLNDASASAVKSLLDGLAPAKRSGVLQAMGTLRTDLDAACRTPPEITLRPHRPGDIGWITHRQALLYHREYGWDGTYEALVAEILAEFVRKFDPEQEASWIAECEGEIVGSVFLVRKSDEVAKLRLLYVEPSMRGRGLGARLVEECVRFAREKGYRTLTLWTNDILTAARRIYQAQGFRLVAEEPHHSFGKDLVGQTWELELR
jgi:DNA-binding MarR family transcriptional regulator/GNAT superfamily N-acetyltransferase